MPDEYTLPREDTERASERFGNEAPPVSERFGTVPNASENTQPVFRNASETNHENPPRVSERVDEAMTHPPRQPAHTLTVREVEKLFEEAGTAVTERSILNWCKPNREGVCRLNCGYDRSEKRWFVSSGSVARVIDEERKKQLGVPKASLEFSEARERLSESFGNENAAASESFGTFRKEGTERSETVRNDAEARAAQPPQHGPIERQGSATASTADAAFIEERDRLQKRVQELEKETAAGQYKDELITTLRERLVEDRKDYNERMTFLQNQVEKLQTTNAKYVDDLIGISRHVGELEAENRLLRQLPAGDRDEQSRNEDARNARPVPAPLDLFEPREDTEVTQDEFTNHHPPFHV